MKRFFFLSILMLLLGISCTNDSAQEVLVPEDQLVFEAEDKVIFEEVSAQFQHDQDLPIGALISKVGRYFLDVPYVGHTLEVADNEALVINLRELDCTTFAENCLAISRTIKKGEPSLQKYAWELQNLRYRDGVRDAYPSRLHYFSDWIHDNKAKKLVTTPSDEFGEPLPIHVDFMSNHPDSYKHLVANPDFVPVVAAQEKAISDRNYYFLPKHKVEANEHLLQEGDLVGITTSMDGLDIAHVGVLVFVDERVHLMHASSSGKKVLISEKPLADYLRGIEKHTGIMVLRPVEIEQEP